MGAAFPGGRERRKALKRFYGAVHHQGSVYPATAASLLLRETARTLPVRPIAPAPSQSAAADTVAPQIVAAFADLDRHRRVYAPTTVLLRTFHEALGPRVRERTALLAEQLISPDPGSRLDAVRMSGELMRTWRGDHTRLLLLVADQLTTADEEVAAEAAAVLEACHPIAARPGRHSPRTSTPNARPTALMCGPHRGGTCAEVTRRLSGPWRDSATRARCRVCWLRWTATSTPGARSRSQDICRRPRTSWCPVSASICAGLTSPSSGPR